jgi:beta-lactamase regulating signal transducer with metallopeptidase domain
MNAFSIPGAPAWFNLLLAVSVQAAVLAALIWIVVKIFGPWIPPAWRALMWSLVIVRVLLPFSPPSQFSLQNLFVAQNPAPLTKTIAATPIRPEVQVTHAWTSNVFYNPVVHALPVKQPAAQRAPQPIGKPLALAWTAGATFFLILLLARAWFIRRRLVRDEISASPAVLDGVRAASDSLSLRWPLRVMVSDHIASPALTGFLPARLIIPTSFNAREFTPAQMRHIILHELAHIQQGHLVLHWLALIARAIHWFNPAIHFAGAQLRQQCELAADAAALRNCSLAERAAYGETILQVLAQSTAPPTLLALGMAEEARHLQQRLRALASPPKPTFHLLGIVLAALVAATGLTGATQPDSARSAANAAEEDAKGLAKNRLSLPFSPLQPPSVVAPPSTLVQDARFLIEMGRLSEAENLLQQAIKTDPGHRTAFYYLNLIKEIRYALETRKPEIKVKDRIADIEQSWNAPVAQALPSPNPFARTNVVRTSSARQKLYQKLETMRIDGFPFREEMPLGEVLKRLGEEVRRKDPTGRGVNFIISKAASQGLNSRTAIDPITGLTEESQRVDLDPEDFKIKFDPPIRDVTLSQFLDAMVMVAQPSQPPPATVGLRYSVEDYAIVFSAKVAEREKFYSRTFRLNPNSFRQGLQGGYSANPFGSLEAGRQVSTNAGGTGVSFVTTVTNTSALQSEMRAFFAAAGVDFSPDNVAAGAGGVPYEFGVSRPGEPQKKAMFFNERTGVLMVRATLRDLDTIEKAIHVLNSQTAQTVAQATSEKQNVAGAESSELLVTQSFKVDPNTFKQRLEAVLPRIRGTTIHDIPAQVRAFADMAGVRFPASSSSSGGGSQKSIFYNEATGHLFVRATPQELVLLGRAIANRNFAPPQVTIVVRAFELPAEQVAHIKTNFVADRAITATNEFVIGSTNVLPNPPAALLEQTKQVVDSMKNVVIATNFAPASQFIIARPVLNTLIKQLEGAKGVDLMTMPNVTTLVGRQARISIEETHTVVTPNGTNFNQVQIPFGWAFDCFPESLDGTDVQITTGAAQTKFLGYDTATTPQLARLHVEATGSRARLPLGSSQAFLMPIPSHKDLPVLGDLPYLGRLFRAEQEPRHILILITPVIIDRAGNAVYPQAE